MKISENLIQSLIQCRKNRIKILFTAYGETNQMPWNAMLFKKRWRFMIMRQQGIWADQSLVRTQSRGFQKGGGKLVIKQSQAFKISGDKGKTDNTPICLLYTSDAADD